MVTCFLIALILAQFTIAFAQTIANIPDLDIQQPNFYRWMEQNAYICESPQPDAPVFLSESDAEQFHCIALCGDPISDKPHLACAKRPSQKPHEWPQCQIVPPLCILNFVQEFMALKVARGEFSTEERLAHQQPPQPVRTVDSTTPPSAFTPERLFLNRRLPDGSFERLFHFNPMTVSSASSEEEFTVVDGETDGTEQQRQRKRSKSSESTKTAQPKKPQQTHLVDRKVSLEFKDAPSIPLPPKLPFGTTVGNEKQCPPDKDPLACRFWAGNGECRANPAYMLRECQRACGLCGNVNEEFRS